MSQVCMDDFSSIKVIGQGTYGKVLLVRKNDSGEYYAMKILKKAEIEHQNQVLHTLSERNILQRVSHPFIIRLNWAFQTKKKLIFVLEYCLGGELFFHLSKSKRFTEERAKFYAACIILAIEHLHSLNIVYREQVSISLKPENILIDEDGFAKLTDFGLSKENITGSNQAMSLVGTAEYLAPEILHDEGYGKSVDWWSLGVLIYEMLTGWPPFYAEDQTSLFESIVYDEIPKRPTLTQTTYDLISQLLQKKPEDRLGYDARDALAVKQHQWFEDFPWEQLLAKQITPPYVPEVQNPSDTSYFSNEFTEMSISMSTEDVSSSNRYQGFSYQGST